MPIIAKDSGGGDFELAPVGNQQAVCAFVEDIGTHDGSYNGKPTRNQQIVICWELAEKMTLGDNAGKPFMLSKFYTLSLGEKSNLRKDLQSWRGVAFTEQELRAFDVEKLNGVNCLLNVVAEKKQDGKEFRKIASVSPLIKGMPKIEVFNKMPPEWIAKKRAESLEAQEQQFGAPLTVYENPSEESLPF